MRVLIIYRKIIARIIMRYYRSKKNTGKAIMFLPHSGMSKSDYIDLFNYKSDSALTFAHYLLVNDLCKDKEFVVFVPSKDDLESSYKKAEKLFPGRKIKFITWDYCLINYNSRSYARFVKGFGKLVVSCSHIFSSDSFGFQRYANNQIIVDLNYFSAPFKNDLLSSDSKYYMHYDRQGREYSKILLSSEVSIRLIMACMNLPREKYLDFGLCRNDNLLEEESSNDIRKSILSSVSYRASKILLYIPTHRDYEKKLHNVARTLFGYDMDMDKLDAVLKEEGIIIICKLHPVQSKEVISMSLPESVVIHKANHKYGLCELMKVSDAMIGDYSSGYFDYLLLDKPIIFNFYDVERYKKERGFTFNPVESIVAGDVVKDSEGFIKALKNLEINKTHYKEKRAFVRDLIFAYQDTHCCERVYDYFFDNKQFD